MIKLGIFGKPILLLVSKVFDLLNLDYTSTVIQLINKYWVFCSHPQMATTPGSEQKLSQLIGNKDSIQRRK